MFCSAGAGADTADKHERLIPHTTRHPDRSGLADRRRVEALFESIAGTVRGPDASVELEIARDGTLTMACNIATASIEAVHIVFREQWTNNGMQCQDLSGDQSRFVYSKVLNGTITWSIAHQQLTITKGGVGLLKFTKATAGQ